MEKTLHETMDGIYNRYVADGGNVISVLQDIQGQLGYVVPEAVEWFAEKSGIPTSKFFGVATFYAQFYLKPRGRHVVTACCGTACHVKGSDRIISRLTDELGLSGGEETTEDGRFTLEKVACVGACSIAPVVIVDRKVYGTMTPDKMVRELKTYGDDDA